MMRNDINFALVAMVPSSVSPSYTATAIANGTNDTLALTSTITVSI